MIIHEVVVDNTGSGRHVSTCDETPLKAETEADCPGMRARHNVKSSQAGEGRGHKNVVGQPGTALDFTLLAPAALVVACPPSILKVKNLR